MQRQQHAGPQQCPSPPPPLASTEISWPKLAGWYKGTTANLSPPLPPPLPSPPLPSLQSDDLITKVMQLAAALETARFTEFWAITANSKELLNQSEWAGGRARALAGGGGPG